MRNTGPLADLQRESINTVVYQGDKLSMKQSCSSEHVCTRNLIITCSRAVQR